MQTVSVVLMVLTGIQITVFCLVVMDFMLMTNCGLARDAIAIVLLVWTHLVACLVPLLVRCTEIIVLNAVRRTTK
jgi:hypothetical protein